LELYLLEAFFFNLQNEEVLEWVLVELLLVEIMNIEAKKQWNEN
jgi:hypothetical protein